MASGVDWGRACGHREPCGLGSDARAGTGFGRWPGGVRRAVAQPAGRAESEDSGITFVEKWQREGGPSGCVGRPTIRRMRAVQRKPRRVVTAIAFLLVAAIVLSVRGGAEDARAADKARLRLVDTHPLTVSGRKFRVAERVRVRAAGSGVRRTRRVTAGGSGGFEVSFRSITFNLCVGSVTVFVRGSDGSRARLKVPGLKCPPAHDRGSSPRLTVDRRSSR